jgi:predicted dehydrogenase
VRFDPEAAQAQHPVAVRASAFMARDRLLPIEADDKAEVLATTHVDGRPMPVCLSHPLAKGRAIALTLGGEPAALGQPSVVQLIERSVRAVTAPPTGRTVRVGLVGYGGTFNMGRNHIEWMAPATGLETVAVCDSDPARTEAAKQELGDHIRTYNDMHRLFADDGVDLVVTILPHDVHGEAAVAALQAGKHLVTEKPFALTLDEADRMIAAAKEAGVMLSCFHNHRWDGDLIRLRELAREGRIGSLYHMDIGSAHYIMPRDWWRSSKKTSGGILWDWGAHHVDSLLSVMQKRIESVSGLLQKRYWHNMTNEDFARVTIRFADGATASLEQGELAAIERSRYRLLGTTGGLTAPGADQPITLVQCEGERRSETHVDAAKSDWPAFYRNIANHLLMGEPLAVTAQQARRVTGVLALAEQSAHQGGTPLALPGEDTVDPHYEAPIA